MYDFKNYIGTIQLVKNAWFLITFFNSLFIQQKFDLTPMIIMASMLVELAMFFEIQKYNYKMLLYYALYQTAYLYCYLQSIKGNYFEINIQCALICFQSLFIAICFIQLFNCATKEIKKQEIIDPKTGDLDYPKFFKYRNLNY
ncbi:unnamed protein product [Caenorhabditis angaria]|uniref:Transmembrane protein n=1 Tax=Caenorhabditis angaria TaxID=860376 RepID=A0A9P1IBP9_9PELO|nr:unnamed protein product [Caenorhabditis angaria]